MTNARLKIAFLIPTADSRGPLNQIEILAEELERGGVDSMLVTMREGKGKPSTLFTVCLRMRHVWDVRALVQLRRVVRDNGITILHSRLNSANFWGSLYRFLFRSSIHVMNVTNSIETSFRYNHGKILGYLHRFAFQRVINGADAIVTNASYLKEEIELSCRPRSSVTVIHNAMRSREFSARNSHAPQVIGVVSRIEYYKRVDDLIRAYPKIVDVLPEVELHVVGAGEFLQVCKDIVAGFEEKVRGGVSFLGHRDDIQALLSDFSVLVHTSESEGQPNAVLEAMNAGVPIVCSNYPGVEALIQNGVTGLIYRSTEYDDLAQTVIRILTDEGLRERLAFNAWRYIQNSHAPARAAADFMRIYGDMIARKEMKHAKK